MSEENHEELESDHEELGDGGPQEPVKRPKGYHGGGKVIHIHVPFPLLERIERVLELTDMENLSQMGRIGFKRLCEEVEARQKALAELNRDQPGQVDNSAFQA